jgi:FKBP-type peptidyl-prolyl cis-trans isomerase
MPMPKLERGQPSPGRAPTQDTGAPYRWKLGDGSTIRGLEEAVTGGPGVEPMRPGGIRRVIIPSSLGYES